MPFVFQVACKHCCRIQCYINLLTLIHLDFWKQENSYDPLCRSVKWVLRWYHTLLYVPCSSSFPLVLRCLISCYVQFMTSAVSYPCFMQSTSFFHYYTVTPTRHYSVSVLLSMYRISNIPIRRVAKFGPHHQPMYTAQQPSCGQDTKLELIMICQGWLQQSSLGW
jgi:hypothetical protein